MTVISKEEATKLAMSEDYTGEGYDISDWEIREDFVKEVVKKAGLTGLPYIDESFDEAIDTAIGSRDGYGEEKEVVDASAKAISLLTQSFDLYMKGFELSKKDMTRRDVAYITSEVCHVLRGETTKTDLQK